MAEHPKKIARYEISRELGEGAMGLVYLAYDPFVDRQVAIKVSTLVDDENPAKALRARKMFFNEAQAAGALDNPNILHIYDAGEQDGDAYIVMEYVAGGDTLKSYATPETLLPVETVVRLMEQCARALDYAHSKGVTHRDIKPANLMLTRDHQVKIGDFGIAQRTKTDATQIMGAFGSPRYMSPEQLHDADLTSRTDLYSLGIVLYELLTGQPPFQATVIGQLIFQILNDELPDLRQIRPEVPPVLDTILRRATRKDADDRFQTGAEFAAALAEVFSDLGTQAQELSSDEKFAALRGLHFFEDFLEEELREVMDVASWEYLASGEQLITEGDTGTTAYFIVSGEVGLSIQGNEIGSAEAGESVGEIGYLSDLAQVATVTAKTAVTAVKLDSNHLEWASVPCQIRFNKTFQRILLERLSSTSRELARLM